MSGILHIIIKEFRQRSRGLSTLALIFFYSLGLTAVVFLTITTQLSTSGFTNNRYEFAQIGKSIAIFTYFVQLFFSVMFSLSFTASTIATERDQSTFETLNLTRFTNFEILGGKLLSSFLFNLLLLVTALPLYTIAFIFGGLEPSLISTAISVLISTSFLISVLGLLVSLTSTDVRTSMARSFLTLIGVGVASSVTGMVTYTAITSSATQSKLLKILGLFGMLINPVFPVIDAITPNQLRNITTDWGTLYEIISPNASSSISLFGIQIMDFTLTTSSVLFQIWCALILFSVTLALYPIYRSRRFI